MPSVYLRTTSAAGGRDLCNKAGSNQSFFFQLAFPASHEYEGQSLAVFECTECAHEDYFIPKMLQGPLLGADIPSGFLDSYQVNFSIFVFDTSQGQLRHDYGKPKVKFESWNFSDSNIDAAAALGFVGGNPTWILDDETPSTYAGVTPMSYLFQLEEGLKFEIEEDAPKQVTLGLDGKSRRSKNNSYSLFLANQLYFFGTSNGEDVEKKVYVITQRS